MDTFPIQYYLDRIWIKGAHSCNSEDLENQRKIIQKFIDSYECYSLKLKHETRGK